MSIKLNVHLIIFALSLTLNHVLCEIKVNCVDGICVELTPDQSYSKVCPSAVVTNIQEAKALKDCVIIDGFLEIKGFKGASSMLALEQYLSSIEEIEEYLKISGNNQVWSLQFLRNLKKIKGMQLESNKYSFVLLDNQNLQNLWQNDQVVEIERGNIYIHYNPRLCYSLIEKILDSNSEKEVHIDEVKTTMITNGFSYKCNSTLTSWPIYVQKTSKNFVVLQWQKSDYQSNDEVIKYTVFHKLLEDLEDYHLAHWWYQQEFNYTYDSTTNNQVTFMLENLIPNAEYVCYVQVSYSRFGVNDDRSENIYFKTSSSRPGRVQKLKTHSSKSSEVLVKWEVPQNVDQFVLTHFVVKARFIVPYRTVEEIREINYCDKPIDQPNSIVFLRDESKEELYYDDDNDDNKPSMELIESLKVNDEYFYYIYKMVDASQRQLLLQDLKHFSTYEISVKACSGEKCGIELMHHERTLSKREMDDIPRLTLLIDPNNNGVKLNWKFPENPNGFILHSSIRFGLVTDEPTDFTEICIPNNSENKNAESFELMNLDGKYKFQVRVTSSAGHGSYTQPELVKMSF